MNPILQAFAEMYRIQGIPPPHILLIGKDDAQNTSIAHDFAEALGVAMNALSCEETDARGDLTALLTNRTLIYLSGVQNLKRSFLEFLTRALETGEIQISIGVGSAARSHIMNVDAPSIVATCPTKSACPASLMKQIRCIIPVEPYSAEEMQAVLEQEAWRNQISFEPGAAELLVRCGNGLSSLMLHRFKKVLGQIEPVKRTSKPCLSAEDVSLALAKLRIEIPSLQRTPAFRSIDTLSGQEFEALIKALLLEMGFQADLTEVTGDGGIDIIAQLDRPFSGGRYIFQCKRYAQDNLIGSPAVRDFYGAVTADRAVKGIFITTSDFSAQAREFATQTGIELVNRDKLIELLDEYKVLPP